eukprot:gene20972-biopygen8608
MTWRPGGSGQSWGNRKVARAWRGRGAGYRHFFGLGWRGRGAGMARAFPVPPGPQQNCFITALWAGIDLCNCWRTSTAQRGGPSAGNHWANSCRGRIPRAALAVPTAKTCKSRGVPRGVPREVYPENALPASLQISHRTGACPWLGCPAGITIRQNI